MITKEFLKNLSYSDFVAFINQTNVLPGAFDTLNRWVHYSKIDKNSYILDIACTTGFKSREISYFSGCRGEGFDISEYAVKIAKKNQISLLKEEKIKYVSCDGYKFKSTNLFSHIIVGAGLGFFSDPKAMLMKSISMLKEGGVILASPYYVFKKIPNDLVNDFYEIVGINPTNDEYKTIMDIYLNSGLEVIYEERKKIIPETEEEMKIYVNSTIERAKKILNLDEKAEDYIKTRLYSIKSICNKLREYQGYSVLILRKRDETYPNRYVELF